MNLIDQINAEIEKDRNPQPTTQEVKPVSLDELVLDTVGISWPGMEAAPKPKRKRGRPAKVEEGVFIEMWNAALESGSLEEVAKMIGSSPASTAVKASNLRKRGVALGRFKRGRRKKI